MPMCRLFTAGRSYQPPLIYSLLVHMKTLFLLRHAKSSWDDASLSDFERPLNDRGRRTAPFMGEFMRKSGLEPPTMISSPASRAKHTAELARKAAGFKCELKFDERIYEATPGTLIQ